MPKRVASFAYSRLASFSGLAVRAARASTAVAGILDRFPGAAAAYSLRALSKDTINVVRVRRDSDNAEADFTATEVSDGTLLAWVGTGATDNGFVTTWYDQSGNSNDATQATAASQPKIVDAGVLVTENGKAALDFDGVDDHLVGNPNTSSADYSFISVKTPKTAEQAAGSWFFALDVNNRIFEAFGDTPGVPTVNQIGVYLEPPGDAISQTTSGLEIKKYLTSLFADASNSTYYINGASVGALSGADTTGIAAGSELQIGQRFGVSPTDPCEQFFTELLLYPSDQSSNRTSIEANIADYYGITLA